MNKKKKEKKKKEISRRLGEEVAAAKGAEAHTLGSTGLDNVGSLTSHNPTGFHGLSRG
jgi:hypothetical protein